MGWPPVEMAADFHIHPNYSIDGRGTLAEFCEAAIKREVLELCFTTHYDADPNHPEDSFIVIEGNKEKLSDEAIQFYLDDIERVYQEYGGLGLMIRPGLEFGWFSGCEKEIARVMGKFPFHFCLGAVHTLNGNCLCVKESAEKIFSKMTLEQMADLYFEKLSKCAESGLFECLAHIDVYRRFGLEYYGNKVNSIHRGRIEKLFDVMIANKVGYEINTSAIRHGHAEYYPTMEIVNLAREKGVLLRCLGSDAHEPEQLALDFETASPMAYELFPYVDE